VATLPHEPNRTTAAWDAAGLQRNTRRKAAAAIPAEYIRVPRAVAGISISSFKHEAWNDSCINHLDRLCVCAATFVDRANGGQKMQDSPSNQTEHLALPTRTSRRAVFSWAMKLAGGAALVASGPGTHWVQLAAAQDDEIILTAAASEVGARPGGAYANGAAARAAADSEAGSSTQGAGSMGGPGSGSGPGESNGAGPGSQNGMGGGGTGGGTGAGPGESTGAGPGSGGGGGGTGGGTGDQSGGGGGY
jgi:hypothetical protein